MTHNQKDILATTFGISLCIIVASFIGYLFVTTTNPASRKKDKEINEMIICHHSGVICK